MSIHAPYTSNTVISSADVSADILGLQNGTLWALAYKFSAYRSSAYNSGNGAFALITFDTSLFDTGSNYSVSTGLFTAPIAGFYQFNWQATSSTGGVFWTTSLTKNGSVTEVARGSTDNVSSYSSASSGGSKLLQLAASDTIQVNLFSDTTHAGATGKNFTFFEGFLVSVT